MRIFVLCLDTLRWSLFVSVLSAVLVPLVVLWHFLSTMQNLLLLLAQISVRFTAFLRKRRYITHLQ